MFKKENGITLVALVVTIIVLLILAGVSITMLSGDDGIASNAGEAKTKTDEGNAREAVNFAIQSANTEYWADFAEGSGTKVNSPKLLDPYLQKQGYTIVCADGESLSEDVFVENADDPEFSIKSTNASITTEYEVNITLSNGLITSATVTLKSTT